MGSRELRIGSPVLGYQVEAVIGRGGMGVVYRVFDPALDRHVALKLIAPELASDESFRDRFLQESRAVAALEHPNVVPVYSAGQLEETLYLAMRYVEGKDLRQLLADGPLPPERAINICEQVAAALDAAHERGLVHRDVKPSNILLGDGDHVYLGDFGLSRQLPATGSIPGSSLGTIAYVAPEQIRGEAADGRADCYSLACVLYECLSGEPPFADRSDVAVLFAHLEEQPPTLPALEAVLATGLAKNPDDRYPSCVALVDAARQALGLEPRRRRWPLVVLAAAVMVAAAIGVAGVTLGRGGSAAAGQGGRLASIDARSGAVGNMIRIGDQPGGVAAADGQVWVTSAADSGLWNVDARTGNATRRPTTGRPTNVAVAAGDVWVGEDGGVEDSGVERFDGGSGEAVASKRTAGDAPFVSGSGTSIWAAGPDDVYRITPQTDYAAKKRHVSTIPNPPHVNEVRTRWSINGVAAGADGVWVVGDASDQRLWRVNKGGNGVRRVHLGFPPSGVADGAGAVWVTDQLDDRLVRIDPTTGRVTAAIAVGREPMAVVVAPSGVWVANAIDGTVSRIDPHRDAVVATLPVGFSPTALAAAGDKVWVAGNAS